MQRQFLLNLDANINDLMLKQGSTTNFNQNINNGTSGVDINNIERQGGSNVNFAAGVNHYSVDNEIIADNNKAENSGSFA